ncbi:AlbA family DNA-binding domain-containing protein [Burkholderia plantarii]|uniref:Schlafen AlbA-2 domain-containing protein n=1 Tax=Burkholderia plantarii TaxID=41899 RepID=A0A0B6RVN9_BURPL|nr:ATP-binding protein [Burkholderia plantarii]AJK46224.1 hypothetical protein BGL_1c17150 [Burkholderia plantarii]
MLPKLDQSVLQSIVDTAARESIELDFKREFNPESPDHRRGLIEDVCALANARGGWLLLGIREVAGAATYLSGIQIDDEDTFRLRLLRMIESGLEPRLGGVHVECVPLPAGGYVVGLRVPQSWTGPHRTSSGRRFMVRGDGSNSEYDIHGLRHAFLVGGDVTRAWEAFRDDRIARYYANRLPIAVKAGAAALTHLYPLSAAATPNTIDVTAAAALPDLVRQTDENRRSRLHVDGVVRCGGAEVDGESTRHVQVFRSGALEAFEVIDPDVGKPGLALPWVQRTVTELLPRWLRGLAKLEVTGPYQFGVTLAGVRDMRPMRDEDGFPYWGESAREETLLLPAQTIDPAEFDETQFLEEMRVLLHQAFGRDGVHTRYF